jgi:hypothetical protein
MGGFFINFFLSVRAGAAFHAIYFATLHKAEIGEEQYDEALRTLIYGMVIQLI